MISSSFFRERVRNKSRDSSFPFRIFKTAKETRVDFGELIEKYLNEDLNLKGVFLIIDSRHLPTNDDLMVYDFLLQFDVPIYIVATKTDKLGTTIVQKNINQIN